MFVCHLMISTPWQFILKQNVLNEGYNRVMNAKTEYHITQTDKRLQRIEDKIDVLTANFVHHKSKMLTKSKHQAMMVSFLISMFVAIAAGLVRVIIGV